MTQYTVTKSQLESYTLDIHSVRCSWARITIAEHGDLMVQSDCGDFAYSWRSYGTSFKEFLISIMGRGDTSYLYNKLSNPEREKELDVKSMKKEMKERILKYRRENYHTFSEESARELWDEVNDLLSNGLDENYFHWKYNDLPGSKYDVFGDLYETDIIQHLPDYSTLTFCEVVAPLFAETLKNELNPQGGK